MEIRDQFEDFNVHGSVHYKNILAYIQQGATLHRLLYLETALHVSGCTFTHYQERIRLYLQHLGLVTTVRQIPDAVDTFVGPCILSIFYYISNKIQRYTVYLYLETALHVLGGTFTHHQERIQLYLQHLVFVTTLLLPAAIVEELGLV
jgi:hypothetical protein